MVADARMILRQREMSERREQVAAFAPVLCSFRLREKLGVRPAYKPEEVDAIRAASELHETAAPARVRVRDEMMEVNVRLSPNDEVEAWERECTRWWRSSRPRRRRRRS